MRIVAAGIRVFAHRFADGDGCVLIVFAHRFKSLIL
jgi:hypothetical protein